MHNRATVAEHRAVRGLLRHRVVASFSRIHNRFESATGRHVAFTHGRRWGLRLNLFRSRLGLAVYVERVDEKRCYAAKEDV